METLEEIKDKFPANEVSEKVSHGPALDENEMEEQPVNEKCWYLFNNINSVYLTPFVKAKTRFYTVEDGEPTPKQIAEELTKGAEYDPVTKVFSRVQKSSKKTPVRLAKGVYKFKVGRQTGLEYLVPISVRKDNSIAPISNSTEQMRKILDDFLSKEEMYSKYELSYRLGIFAYGPPGSGKTMSIRSLLNKVVDQEDAVVIYIDNALPSTKFMEVLKNSCEHRLKVFIFEEFTEFLNNPTIPRNDLLNFLDGEGSVERSITIATTNFPQLVPENIKNRPGRFDKQLLFSNPREADRRVLIKHFLDREPTELELERSRGLTVAAIKECCIDVLFRDRKLSESLEEFKANASKSK